MKYVLVKQCFNCGNINKGNRCSECGELLYEMITYQEYEAKWGLKDDGQICKKK